MFPRRATTKVLSRHQNRRAFIPRFVQHEFRIFRAVRPESPVVENKLPESSLLDSFQKLLGHDLVRIDIGPIQRRHAPAMHGKWFHDFQNLKFVARSLLQTASLTGTSSS